MDQMWMLMGKRCGKQRPKRARGRALCQGDIGVGPEGRRHGAVLAGLNPQLHRLCRQSVEASKGSYVVVCIWLGTAVGTVEPQGP